MPYTFETHNTNDSINANMTCLQGYNNTPQHKLVEIFGEPIYHGGSKVYCEWVIEVTDENNDTDIITIYDWKNYDDSAADPDYNEWHVGGFHHAAERVLNEIIGAYNVQA